MELVALTRLNGNGDDAAYVRVLLRWIAIADLPIPPRPRRSDTLMSTPTENGDYRDDDREGQGDETAYDGQAVESTPYDPEASAADTDGGEIDPDETPAVDEDAGGEAMRRDDPGQAEE